MILFKIGDESIVEISSIINIFAGSIRDKIATVYKSSSMYADRKAHVLLQPGAFNMARGITRRKSSELMVKWISRGLSRNFMRDVVSTCANIHVCGRRAGVQYEVPSHEFNEYNVESATI